MTINFSVMTQDGTPTSAVLFAGGKSYVASPTHPNFTTIIEILTGDKVAQDEQHMVGLFSIEKGIDASFKKVSERVRIENGIVHFDGDPMDNALTKAIVAFHREGNASFMPLVNFLEKIQLNPNEHSREQMFGWMGRHDFGIHPDGDFIAYKGLDSSPDGVHRSSHAGEAWVNGERHNGKIPNIEGAVVEMPRSKVTFDPRVGCHHGLHVGNWRYASTFAHIVRAVKVNPRDVVSVPTDSSEEKMRVCRYRVLGVVTKPLDNVLFSYAGEIKTPVLDEVPEMQETLKTGEEQFELDSEKAVQEVQESQEVTPTPTTPATATKAKRVRNRTKAPAKAPATKRAVMKAPAKPAKATKAAAPAPTKRAPAKVAGKPLPKAKKPVFYEDFSKADFEGLSHQKMRWLAKEWALKTSSNPTKIELVAALTRATKVRMKKYDADRKSITRVKIV